LTVKRWVHRRSGCGCTPPRVTSPQASGTEGSSDARDPRMTPLVGRESEVTCLERWEQAKAGNGNVVLLWAKQVLGRVVGPNAPRPCHPGAPTRWECRSAGVRSAHGTFLWLICSNGYCGLKPHETPDEKLENNRTLR